MIEKLLQTTVAMWHDRRKVGALWNTAVHWHRKNDEERAHDAIAKLRKLITDHQCDPKAHRGGRGGRRGRGRLI